jgi:hypothetical protein
MFSARLFALLSMVVRAFSVAAVLFIVAGLIGFLTDEVGDTSKVQATRIQSSLGETQPVIVTVDISQPNPPAAVERVRESQHTSAREVIDDAGDALAAPFTWIASGSDPWVRRLLYSALGLLFYGVLLQVVADWLRRLSDESRRQLFTEREVAAAAERRASGTYASPA